VDGADVAGSVRRCLFDRIRDGNLLYQSTDRAWAAGPRDRAARERFAVATAGGRPRRRTRGTRARILGAWCSLFPLVPAQAGTQARSRLDSRLRGNERWREPNRTGRTLVAAGYAMGEWDLPLIWAGIIGIAVALYVILDGFDLGVGILFPFARDEKERDQMISTLAPFWDGNETWLV